MEVHRLATIIAAVLFWLVVASAQTLKTPSAVLQNKHTITPEDVLSIREPSDIKLSPDGKNILFVITEPHDPKKPRASRTSNVWIVSTDGSEMPRPLIPGLKNASTPRWSPDGRTISFLSDRGDALTVEVDTNDQIYLLREGEKKASRLTSIPGGVEQYEWSPNGKSIAFIAHDQPTNEEQSRKAAGDDAIVLPERDLKYARLWVRDLGGVTSQSINNQGLAIQITKQNFDVRELAWSPANDRLALIVAPSPNSGELDSLSLIVVNRSGEVERTLSKNVSSITGVLRWSPDGLWITFFEIPPTRESNFWLSLASPKSGEVRPLLKDYQGTILTPEWTSDSKALLAQSIEGTHQVISKIDLRFGAFQKIADVMQSQWGDSFSTHGETMVYLAQTTESANDLWVIAKNGEPRRITDFNPQTKFWSFGKVREVVWKNSKDGLTRRGVLITPPDYDPGKPYPTIVNAHPGDTAWWVGFHASKWWDWGQLLASNGYVVFLPNTRGVTGEGGPMHATNSDWGDMSVPDLLDGVDYLISQKIADPNRLGIGGWSNGGFITEFTITRTTRFKAAVAQAGHADFFSLYGTSYLRDGFRMRSGESPYYNRKWYDDHSPIALVKNCRTPTLLLHGELDGGVPRGQASEFYTGLIDAGVDSELVIYPRERHNIQEYGHLIDLQKRILAWFDKYLK